MTATQWCNLVSKKLAENPSTAVTFYIVFYSYSSNDKVDIIYIRFGITTDSNLWADWHAIHVW